MTVAEIQRYLEGATWRLKNKAQFDYVLADLIGASTARIMSKDVEYPPIHKVYPDLFEEVEEKPVEEDLTTKSINNFLAFAMQHNAKQKKEGGEQEHDC